MFRTVASDFNAMSGITSNDILITERLGVYNGRFSDKGHMRLLCDSSVIRNIHDWVEHQHDEINHIPCQLLSGYGCFKSNFLIPIRMCELYRK